MPWRRLRGSVLCTVLAMCGSHVTVADASTATVDTGGGRYSYHSTPIYTADPGEKNDLTVTGTVSAIRIEDLGAVIRPGRGCVGASEHVITCSADSSESFHRMSISLGNLDDTVSTALPSDVNLGAGNDIGYLGSGGSLSGGEGLDMLIGGPGDDTLGDNDRVSIDRDVIDGGAGLDLVDYSGRRAPVTVDLLHGRAGQTGEADMVRNVESAFGGYGNDTLIAGDTTAALLGLGGDDRIVGGPGNDLLAGGTGRDRIRGGPGDDRIEPGGDDSLSLNGPGERQEASGFAPDDKALDLVSCGSGRDHASELGVDRIAADCESFNFVDQIPYGFPSVPTATSRTILRMDLGCDGQAEARVAAGRLRGRLVGATGSCTKRRRRRATILHLSRSGMALLRRRHCLDLRIRVTGAELIDENSGERAWFAYRYRVCAP